MKYTQHQLYTAIHPPNHSSSFFRFNYLHVAPAIQNYTTGEVMVSCDDDTWHVILIHLFSTPFFLIIPTSSLIALALSSSSHLWLSTRPILFPLISSLFFYPPLVSYPLLSLSSLTLLLSSLAILSSPVLSSLAILSSPVLSCYYQGNSSDRLAAKFGVSRAAQDEFTVLSHTRYATISITNWGGVCSCHCLYTRFHGQIC